MAALRQSNTLLKGIVLTGNPIMQAIWSVSQCLAVDASIGGTIIRAFRSYNEGERVTTWLYGLLSVLLLLIAAIVGNLDAIEQTLNITLDIAYLHVVVLVEL